MIWIREKSETHSKKPLPSEIKLMGKGLEKGHIRYKKGADVKGESQEVYSTQHTEV